jgi:hypothetical protein
MCYGSETCPFNSADVQKFLVVQHQLNAMDQITFGLFCGEGKHQNECDEQVSKTAHHAGQADIGVARERVAVLGHDPRHIV